MKIKLISLAVMAAGASAQALAGGFALSEQSVSAMGTANAGRASNPQDASVVYNNPAAMVYFKEAQFTQTVAFIDAQSRIRNAAGGAPASYTAGGAGTNYGNPVPKTFVPSGYFMSGDKGGWAWGIGAYAPFGLKTNYEGTYAGRFGADKSAISVVTIQPVISYKINDKVSVAAGPTINQLDALLTGGDPVVGYKELNGRRIGYGYTLATYIKPDQDTSIGVVYRSNVKYKIDDGSLEFRAASGPAAALTGIYSATTNVMLPESIELAISRKVSSKTTLHAGSTWTRWSRLRTLDVSSTGPSILASSSTPYLWKNTFSYAVGMTHQCDDKLQLRAGLAFDNSPTNPGTRSPAVPSADRYIASVGAGYKLSKSQSIDFSYSYLKENKAHIIAPDGDGAGPATAYAADFRNRASVIGLQFNQKF